MQHYLQHGEPQRKSNLRKQHHPKGHAFPPSLGLCSRSSLPPLVHAFPPPPLCVVPLSPPPPFAWCRFLPSPWSGGAAFLPFPPSLVGAGLLYSFLLWGVCFLLLGGGVLSPLFLVLPLTSLSFSVVLPSSSSFGWSCCFPPSLGYFLQVILYFVDCSQT